MLGCCNRANNLISREKRSAESSWESSGVRIFHDDASSERRFFGDEDARHPTAAELALYTVCPAQRML